MKNGKSVLAVLGLVAAVAAGPAAAQDKGVYVGGSAGIGQYQDSCRGLVVPCDDRDEAWRLFAGYQFNRWFGAELGYANLGKLRLQGDIPGVGAFEQDSRVNGFDLVAVFSIPIVDRLSALGKLGGYRARVATDFTTAGTTEHRGETSAGITFGFGLGYDLGALGIRAEWQRYDNVGGARVGEDTIHFYSLGLLWRF